MQLRNKLKNMNLPRKIGSVIMAIIVYIVIYNIYDPIITVKIDDIPIKIKNEESITNLGKIYYIEDEKTVDVYLKGKQSLVKNVSVNDVKAVADLNNLSITNSVAIKVEVPSLENQDVEIIYDSNDTLHLSIDNYVTKNFQVDLIKENELNSKYYLYKDNFNYSVKISGAQEKIKQINKVAIEVDQSKLTAGHSKSYEIKVYDSFDNEIDQTDLDLNLLTVKYEPIIYNVVEIPLNLIFVGSVPFGYSLTNSTYMPKSIKIAGTNDLLEKYKEININYDISNSTSSSKIILDLKEYLPSGMILQEENSEITINLTIDKLILKEFTVKPKDLSIKNLPENYSYKYVDNSTFSIIVMGEESLLENLSIDNIAPYIDINNQTEGIYQLEVKIPETSDLTLMSTNTIGINIFKLEEVSTPISSETTSEEEIVEDPEEPTNSETMSVSEELESETELPPETEQNTTVNNKANPEKVSAHENSEKSDSQSIDIYIEV